MKIMNQKTLLASAVLAGAIALPSVASAQMNSDDVTEYVPQEQIQDLKNEEREGFDGTLSIAANLNLADNRKVVGQTDGLSTLFGLNLIGGLDYLYHRHEVRNTLTITESWARTPTIPEFVKNTDTVELESLYNYFLLDWMGLFGRLAFQTSIFETEQVTADAVNYEVARLDGTTDTIITDHLTVSKPFEPFSLYQSVGVFAEPYRSKPLNVSARLGAGARETFAKGVLAITDNEDTDGITEVTEIDNVYQVGLEGFLGAKGAFYDKRITYDLGASALIPFINNDPQDRSAIDLMRVGLVGKVSSSVTDWMSVNYQLRVLSDPQLVDDIQVQNALLLTFNYTFIERDGGVEATADDKVKEAEEKLKAAEEKCKELQEEAEKAAAEAEQAKADEEAARAKAAEEAAAKAAEEAEKAEEAAKAAEDAKDAANDAQDAADKAKDAVEGAETPKTPVVPNP